MKVFISGGCKNGKSTFAQDLSKKMHRPGTSLYYLATMMPTDDEDKARIARHREEREGLGFETVEVDRDIHAVVCICNPKGAFLLDSTTALLANEMFAPDGHMDLNACIKVTNNLMLLLHSVNNIVIVSDFIYSDAFLYDDTTEAYRRGLAYIDRQMAIACDIVLEACAGNFIIHKGIDAFKNLSSINSMSKTGSKGLSHEFD